ncbi:hypothetical protein D9619_001262 [Psilocybe cf. subviscida]|uniref:Uncharacterized protein n=1 Tax=Psilocybe cf. subviscida TaxID=2480587 RepID=A0A8H5F443_9AGAR|nr:hypothetical protein D9619_001262 [Psilocybe cf. subviscida]
MRIRIQTQAPLPELKAWFVPDTLESIFSLKRALCQRVPALNAAQCHPKNIVLMLDGFELLDDSPFDAVRDGDLIVIKASAAAQLAQSPPPPRKRKRDEQPSISNSVSGWTKTLQTPAKPRANVSSSDDDSSSDEASDSSSSTSASSSSSSSSSASSSSSTSSSSSSSTSSSSSSSSSSASSTPPRPQPTKKKKHPTASASASTPTPATASTTTGGGLAHVPPGAGKAATHSRNKRRRVKREHEKAKADGSMAAAAAPPPNGLSTTNTMPLGPRGVAAAADGDPASVPLPSSPAAKPPRKKVRLDAPGTDAEVDPDTQLAQAKATALATLDGEANASGSASATPTPAPGAYATPDQIMMLSMRNKNKKKGFRLSMARPIPHKIVFGEAGAPPEGHSAPEPLGGGGGMEVDSTGSGTASQSQPPPQPQLESRRQTYTHARLVPPSELYAQGLLPSNMIVTSVDVEAGLWDDAPPATKKQKAKKKNRTQEQEQGRELGYAEWAEADSRYMDAERDEEGGPMTLDYSDEAGADAGAETRTAAAANDDSEVDWQKAEQAWEAGSPVTDVAAQIAAARVVGWKALDINPRTFSPEVLLKLARVVSIDAEQKTLVVRCLERPASSSSSNRAAFGFAIDGDKEEPLEETRSWADVLVDSWRVLDL